MSAEDIAARFGVTASVVKERLKLEPSTRPCSISISAGR